jgi:hypothetical protein
MSLGVIVSVPLVSTAPHASRPRIIGKGISREKARAFMRLSSNADALVRHKKWLKDIEDQKVARKKASEEQLRIKLEKKRKFRLSQAKKRREYKIESQANYQEEHDDKNEPVQPGEEEQVNKVVKVTECLYKPAWALTESSAHSKTLSQEMVEEEGLLNFIESLDIDAFYQDMEINILVNHLKERIRKLEEDRKCNEDQLHMLCNVSLHSTDI